MVGVSGSGKRSVVGFIRANVRHKIIRMVGRTRAERRNRQFRWECFHLL